MLVCAGAVARAQATMPCPDSLTTPRMVDAALSTAYGLWQHSPQGPIPPACVYESIAAAPLAHVDSAIVQAIELSAEALRRSPYDAVVLKSRVVLLSRARRYKEVLPAVDELFFVKPSAMSEDIHRIAVGAALRMRDTVAVVNRLANAAARFPRASLLAPEYEIWRQFPRLRALVDTVHRALKKDPTLVVGYVNLSSIYGNLDQPDSAIAYAKIALRRGVTRPVVGTALESLIGVRLRRAQMLASPEVWEATLPVAYAVDSTLSTPASRYLIALALSEIVAEDARLAQGIFFGLETGAPRGYARVEITTGQETPTLRVINCDRIAQLEGMIRTARAKLDAGGDQFAKETVPALRGGLQGMSAILAQLKPRCPE